MPLVRATDNEMKSFLRDGWLDLSEDFTSLDIDEYDHVERVLIYILGLMPVLNERGDIDEVPLAMNDATFHLWNQLEMVYGEEFKMNSTEARIGLNFLCRNNEVIH